MAASQPVELPFDRHEGLAEPSETDIAGPTKPSFGAGDLYAPSSRTTACVKETTFA